MQDVHQKLVPGDDGDYVIHNQTAKALYLSHELTISYPLYHILTALFYGFHDVDDWWGAGMKATTAAFLLTALCLYGFVRSGFDSRPSWSASLAGAAVVAIIMLVGPINILTWNSTFYYGYISGVSYHNPTIILLKPFALMLFLYICWALDKQDQPALTLSLLLPISLTALATLAKPNYTIALLPALGLPLSCFLYRHEWQRFFGFFAGICVPALLVLGFQYASLYGSAGDSASETKIIIAPFEVYLLYAPTIPWLIGKFVLSILFPAVVYIVYWCRAVRSTLLNFAWLSFWCGTFYTYVLAESGEQFSAGNFGWTGEITVFLLFVASIVFWIRQSTAAAQGGRQRVMFAACGFVLLLHFTGGLAIYFHPAVP